MISTNSLIQNLPHVLSKANCSCLRRIEETSILGSDGTQQLVFPMRHGRPPRPFIWENMALNYGDNLEYYVRLVI